MGREREVCEIDRGRASQAMDGEKCVRIGASRMECDRAIRKVMDDRTRGHECPPLCDVMRDLSVLVWKGRDKG